ncbi:hypothetical protein [Spiroplasma monobiae]|uniref:Fido domain-containing protein n=1 Tax=Spiroplasma monobiae MQ-1 TaxID=1336748 RepID=A0A2K9LUS7_SPISQ|nr:hypothetical protein [Spiroplasma monobiae]AUM62802.1 hypothetical protein SMONO_v1c05530 [Spiroplasma monobiae MQ-1]
MKEYYKNDEFWICAGADHTFNYMKMLDGKCSLAEIFNSLETRIVGSDFDHVSKLPDKYAEMLADTWMEMRRVILEKGKFIEENNGNHPGLKVSDFKDIYLLLNKDGNLYDQFTNEDENNLVYEKLGKMIKRSEELNTVDEIITEISIFLHKSHVESTFGENSLLFCWFFLQTTLIYKGFSPIVSFPNRHFEILEMEPITDSLHDEIKIKQYEEWVQGESFKILTSFWITKSKAYYEFIEENYM